MEYWSFLFAGIFPCRHAGIFSVISQRLTVGSLVFLPEMGSARFLSEEGISDEQVGQFEEIGYSGCFFKFLLSSLSEPGTLRSFQNSSLRFFTRSSAFSSPFSFLDIPQ